jgi:hypothetical protein
VPSRSGQGGPRAPSRRPWGDLLIANRLSRQAALTYDQVVAEFRGGKGWEAIARNHGVDVTALMRAR